LRKEKEPRRGSGVGRIKRGERGATTIASRKGRRLEEQENIGAGGIRETHHTAGTERGATLGGKSARGQKVRDRQKKGGETSMHTGTEESGSTWRTFQEHLSSSPCRGRTKKRTGNQEEEKTPMGERLPTPTSHSAEQLKKSDCHSPARKLNDPSSVKAKAAEEKTRQGRGPEAREWER